jgi:hypothetical protein
MVECKGLPPRSADSQTWCPEMNWRVKAQFPERVAWLPPEFSVSHNPFITGYFYDFSLLEGRSSRASWFKPHFRLVPDHTTADLQPRSFGFRPCRACPAGRDSATGIAHPHFVLSLWRRYRRLMSISPWAMSQGFNIKSTHPVWMALLGIPKKEAEFSSSAKVIPPASLIA